jgi:hypothetical protein
MDMFRPFRGGLLPANRRIRGNSIRIVFLSFVFACGLLTLSFAGHSQTPQTARGAIRLKVRYKSGDVIKELPRKRFFLIKGSPDQNKPLVEMIKQTTVPSRACYYRSQGASAPLIKWLEDNDCESIYCRAIEERYLSGGDAVPEFKTAYEQALKELKAPELARRWLANYLTAEIRDGFYNLKQRSIDSLIKQAGMLSGQPVMSIMTDRKGTAYLTDIEPGTYTISNLIPAETDKSSILWLCEREVNAADLAIAMRRPFVLSNEDNPKVKCEVIEQPLAVCDK